MISLLLPSRGRPKQFAEFVQSVFATAKNKVEIVVYQDEDDTPYPRIEGVKYVVGPRIVLSECWNACYKEATGDILGHLGDDIRFRSEHWDVLIENRFKLYEDRIVFVHGRDGNEEQRLTLFGTHGFIHRNWVEAVGYFVPPYFSSDFNDTWLNDVANIINRHEYEPLVYTEHLHPALGKGEWDLTHQERLSRATRDNVHELYYSKEMIRNRMVDANNLLGVMK